MHSTRPPLLIERAIFVASVFVVHCIAGAAPQSQQPVVEAKQSGRVEATAKKAEHNGEEASHPSFICAPSLHCNPTNQPAVQDSQYVAGEGTEYWPIFGYRLKITDTLLVVFTFLLFLATGYLYKATRDLVNGSKAAVQHQLRAYLHVVKPVALGLPDRRLSITFAVKNFGQTPARDVRVNYALGALPGFVESEVPPPNFRSTPVIAPTVAMAWEERGVGDPAAWGRLVSGELSVYLVGRVEYTDVFGSHWHTNFRLRWLGPERRPDGEMMFEQGGNDAT